MKDKVKKIIKLLISVGILYFIYKKLDIDFSVIFSGVQYPMYIGAAILIFLTILPYISANRTNLFLKQLGIEEKWYALVKINWISMFQGIILPSSQGFDLLRIYNLEKRHPECRGKAGSVVFIERVIGLVCICFVSLIATLFLDLPEKNKILIIIVLITSAVVLGICIILSKRVQAWISSKSFSNKWINIIYGYCQKIWTTLTYFPYRNVLISSIIYIAVFQLLTILSVFMIFRAYGVVMPFYIHMSLYPIISIISMVPITISGFGVREGMFVYYYSFFGVAPEIAVSVSLVNYLVSAIVPSLIGALLYGIDTIKTKK